MAGGGGRGTAQGRRLSAVGLGLFLMAAVPAGAAELSVTVDGVRTARGKVLVALCTPDRFLKAGCPYTQSEAATPGRVTVTVRGVPPGTYAVQAFHDENGNRDIDRNFLGLPVEGIGFGNDAPMRFGPPRYDDAAVTVGAAGGRTALTLRYLVEREEGGVGR